jgi:hypothetical protein
MLELFADCILRDFSHAISKEKYSKAKHFGKEMAYSSLMYADDKKYVLKYVRKINFKVGQTYV